MRCILNSGRKRKTDKKTFSSRHNDRDFDSNPEHIAKDKSDKNVIWSWCGTDICFDKGELKYYEETFGAQLEQTNQNYIKSRHKERMVTMDEWRKKTMHATEEQILQIGRMEQYTEVEVSLSCFEEYLTWLNKWNDEHGKPFFILNWAMHQDEMGAPHFHLRRAWPCKDEETGLTTTDQTKTLLKASVLPPEPEKKISKKNNPKMTFDKMCREKWIFIARSYGLEIEDTPKPKSEVGLTLEEFQKQKDEKRNKIYQELVKLTKENMAALEKISEWEFLAPKVERFEKWLENEFFYYDTGSPEEQRLIKKQIVSAFANSTKAIQDKFTEQIANFQRQLDEKNPKQQIRKQNIDWER